MFDRNTSKILLFYFYYYQRNKFIDRYNYNIMYTSIRYYISICDKFAY